MGLRVIIGEDDYLVAEAAKKVIGDGTGLEVIDSLTSTNEELQLADIQKAKESFLTPPFLDPVKVTWWKNVDFLPVKGKKGPSEAVKEALEALAKTFAAPLPENQHFILSGAKLGKDSAFGKALLAIAEVLRLEGGGKWGQAKAMQSRAIELAAEHNLKFASGVVEKFIARVGTDMRSIVSEIGKMRDYLGEGGHTITAQDVNEVTSAGAGVEPELWAITDALGVKNLEAAVIAARQFEGDSGFSVMVSQVVEKFFRQLLEFQAGVTEGMTPYAMSKNREFLRYWKPQELRMARWRFLTLREKAVSGMGGVESLIITEMARVCGRVAK